MQEHALALQWMKGQWKEKPTWETKKTSVLRNRCSCSGTLIPLIALSCCASFFGFLDQKIIWWRLVDKRRRKRDFQETPKHNEETVFTILPFGHLLLLNLSPEFFFFFFQFVFGSFLPFLFKFFVFLFLIFYRPRFRGQITFYCDRVSVHFAFVFDPTWLHLWISDFV